jgi:hypothetical protein
VSFHILGSVTGLTGSTILLGANSEIYYLCVLDVFYVLGYITFIQACSATGLHTIHTIKTRLEQLDCLMAYAQRMHLSECGATPEK